MSVSPPPPPSYWTIRMELQLHQQQKSADSKLRVDRQSPAFKIGITTIWPLEDHGPSRITAATKSFSSNLIKNTFSVLEELVGLIGKVNLSFQEWEVLPRDCGKYESWRGWRATRVNNRPFFEGELHLGKWSVERVHPSGLVEEEKRNGDQNRRERGRCSKLKSESTTQHSREKRAAMLGRESEE